MKQPDSDDGSNSNFDEVDGWELGGVKMPVNKEEIRDRMRCSDFCCSHKCAETLDKNYNCNR